MNASKKLDHLWKYIKLFYLSKWSIFLSYCVNFYLIERDCIECRCNVCEKAGRAIVRKSTEAEEDTPTSPVGRFVWKKTNIFVITWQCRLKNLSPRVMLFPMPLYQGRSKQKFCYGRGRKFALIPPCWSKFCYYVIPMGVQPKCHLTLFHFEW